MCFLLSEQSIYEIQCMGYDLNSFKQYKASGPWIHIVLAEACHVYLQHFTVTLTIQIKLLNFQL